MRKIAVLTGLLLLCLLLTSTASARPVEATPDGCLFFAYTDDLNGHYSMVADNATLVGQDLTVWSTCDDEFTVDVDGAPRWGGLNVVSFPIPLESTAITITSGNTTIMWSNLTVFPAANFGAYVEAERALIDPITLSAADLANHEALTVFASSVILWVMTTMVAWRLVNWWVDRYHLEEVV